MCVCECVSLRTAFLNSFLKINFLLLCLQEDEDRSKYAEAMKAEEAKKGSQSKNEL